LKTYGAGGLEAKNEKKHNKIRFRRTTNKAMPEGWVPGWLLTRARWKKKGVVSDGRHTERAVQPLTFFKWGRQKRGGSPSGGLGGDRQDP